jgi:hypothetical protein
LTGAIRAGLARGVLGLCLGLAMPAMAAPPATLPPLVQATSGLEPRAGLLPVWLDRRGGRVLIALTPDSSGDCGEYLYQAAMRGGLGSTPVGLDRSAPGPTHVLRFRRVGPRIYAELENLAFRADGGSADERQAVRESFPPSVVWSAEILAEDPGGAVLADLSGFVVRDAFGAVDALKGAGQGDFRLAADRSYVDVGGARVFPDNLEFDAVETFESAAPGDEVHGIVPDRHAVTLIEHQSLVRLPPPGFTPRLADPRTGAFDTLVADYAAPLDAPVVRRLANRFRLEKTDPAAPRSPVRKPIVFYVDRAAPEPVRSALIEGARWWAQAFDAAGFIDAFRVEVLPEGVSPLDARYNVINWVHRQTRGWSFGGGAITDPRTGEIVKGFVELGSLRARQDRMIFEGLVGADGTGRGGPNDPVVVTLARLRQLAVHETGHALGLAHNMAGSTYGDRASVMDYPPPRVGIVDGRLDFSDAYKIGLGEWDRFAIRWLYSEVPSGAAGAAALETMVRDGYAHGLRYVRDEDARPTGSAHPDGALWDDGPDPVASLANVLAVRGIALANFGPANVPAGAPLSDLRRVIVPVYLFHRYEVDAVSKSIGGVDFTYAVRGDGAPAPRPVSGEAQRRALTALLATLDPAALDLPDSVIDQLSAGRDGSLDHAYEIELFSDSRTPVFDIAAAARAAADITLGDLLEPSRLARVADQGARDPSGLRLPELLGRTIDHVFAQTAVSPRQGQIRREVRARLVAKLLETARDRAAPPTVLADVRAALDRLVMRLDETRAGGEEDLAQARQLVTLLRGPAAEELATLVDADKRPAARPPPGMPIGAGAGESCWFCEDQDSFR